jgi:hypothetical protein
LELDKLQHDRHAACVIAQKYSSATFVSMRFHCRKQIDALAKNVLISISLPL